MQGDTNRKTGRQREAAGTTGAADTAYAVEESIRQAFLTHMGEQQRQYALTVMASRRSNERSGHRDIAKAAREQPRTGHHNRLGEEAVAGNVEPKRRRGEA